MQWPTNRNLKNEAATLALGEGLGRVLRAGDVVLLQGPLGAGKTTLARGLISSLTDETEIVSPTFTLVQTYAADAFDIWHFDLYRLEDVDAVWELGIEEALETGVSLIEWPERLGRYAPEEALTLSLDIQGGARIATLTGSADWTERLHEL